MTMRAKRRKVTVEFYEEGLPGVGQALTNWNAVLMVVVGRPGTWAKVYDAENPEQAYNAVKNLNKREINIPYPDHLWSFASRMGQVFAKYDGPKRGRIGRTQEKEKKPKSKEQTNERVRRAK